MAESNLGKKLRQLGKKDTADFLQKWQAEDEMRLMRKMPDKDRADMMREMSMPKKPKMMKK